MADKLPPPLPQPHNPPRALPVDYVPAGPQPNNDAQRVFDTVVGPNLRLRDNLIQLACVVIGIVAGIIGGRLYARDPDSASLPMMASALIGMVAALVLSGLVIGIVRWRGARRA